MAQKLTIDLKKNPKVADVVSEMQPGDPIKVMGSIVHMDDQSLVIEVDEVVEVGAPDVDEEDGEPSEDGGMFGDDAENG